MPNLDGVELLLNQILRIIIFSVGVFIYLFYRNSLINELFIRGAVLTLLLNDLVNRNALTLIFDVD